MLSAESMFLSPLQQIFTGYFLHVRCCIYTEEKGHGLCPCQIYSEVTKCQVRSHFSQKRRITGMWWVSHQGRQMKGTCNIFKTSAVPTIACGPPAWRPLGACDPCRFSTPAQTYWQKGPEICSNKTSGWSWYILKCHNHLPTAQ